MAKKLDMTKDEMLAAVDSLRTCIESDAYEDAYEWLIDLHRAMFRREIGMRCQLRDALRAGGAAWNAASSIPTANLTPGIVAELVDSLTHMRYCAHCAESDWNDCEGGRAALAALARVRPATPKEE